MKKFVLLAVLLFLVFFTFAFFLASVKRSDSSLFEDIARSLMENTMTRIFLILFISVCLMFSFVFASENVFFVPPPL